MTKINELGYRYFLPSLMSFIVASSESHPYIKKIICKEYFTTSCKRSVVRRPECHKLCIHIILAKQIELYNKAFINDIFNPEEKIEKRLEAMEHRINQKLDSISRCNRLQEDKLLDIDLTICKLYQRFWQNMIIMKLNNIIILSKIRSVRCV